MSMERSEDETWSDRDDARKRDKEALPGSDGKGSPGVTEESRKGADEEHGEPDEDGPETLRLESDP